MKHFYTLFFFILIASDCFSQLDTTYVGQYEKPTAITVHLGNNYIVGVKSSAGNRTRKFYPNKPLAIGAGLSIYNTVLSFSYSHGFDFMRNKKKGKTTSTDFQFHKYGRKTVIDTYFQKYKGFYEKRDDSSIDLHPEMKMNLYGVNIQYITNNQKFSYPAAFNQSEKQLKSAGSILVGGSFYYSKVEADSIFLSTERSKHRNMQIGINGGYAYTWALKRWQISVAGTFGINVGGKNFKRIIRDPKIHPSFIGRLSAGYNQENYSLGLRIVNNITTPSFSNNKTFAMISGNIQLHFTYRIGAIPIVSKVVNKIDQILGMDR